MARVAHFIGTTMIEMNFRSSQGGRSLTTSRRGQGRKHLIVQIECGRDEFRSFSSINGYILRQKSLQHQSASKTHAAQHNLDPTTLKDLLHEEHMSDEASGPEDTTQESVANWKARIARASGHGDLSPPALAPLNFVEVLEADWGCTEFGGLNVDIHGTWFDSLSARQKNSLKYIRVRGTGRQPYMLGGQAPNSLLPISRSTSVQKAGLSSSAPSSPACCVVSIRPSRSPTLPLKPDYYPSFPGHGALPRWRANKLHANLRAAAAPRFYP
ncbi:hypothetical protein B0H14DRAFT_2633586 [Mycena olivaceomarginata]|nr:hypothetical protein B0H14DRAFT_2633586 [Mycena olivaceomarginata]